MAKAENLVLPGQSGSVVVRKGARSSNRGAVVINAWGPNKLLISLSGNGGNGQKNTGKNHFIVENDVPRADYWPSAWHRRRFVIKCCGANGCEPSFRRTFSNATSPRPGSGGNSGGANAASNTGGEGGKVAGSTAQQNSNEGETTAADASGDTAGGDSGGGEGAPAEGGGEGGGDTTPAADSGGGGETTASADAAPTEAPSDAATTGETTTTTVGGGGTTVACDYPACPTAPCDPRPEALLALSMGALPPVLGSVQNACEKQYIFGMKEGPRNQSYAGCCALGKKIASMENTEEVRCLADFVKKNAINSTLRFWVSGMDVGCSGSYKWCSEDLPFDTSQRSWASNEPQSKGAGSGCVSVSLDTPNYGLFAEQCDAQLPFICE